MKIGEKIVEWSYRGSGVKDKQFFAHTITQTTPTGLLITDSGIELDEHLRLHEKNPRIHQSFFTPFNHKIMQEIKTQRMKDAINEHVLNLDVHSLNENELEQLLNLLKNIKNRQDEMCIEA